MTKEKKHIHNTFENSAVLRRDHYRGHHFSEREHEVHHVFGVGCSRRDQETRILYEPRRDYDELDEEDFVTIHGSRRLF